MSSSPLRPGASRDEELEYYKRQYEQLEADLTDFQASSKELEDQLEKDVDAAEKNERKLRQQVEKLNFEVEEWKAKHKQAKTEANSAQNALQKEITTIREQHRGLALKLRDIEVTNDDYERQARNTTSSLEDLEQKLNVSIERGVLMELHTSRRRSGQSERDTGADENRGGVCPHADQPRSKCMLPAALGPSANDIEGGSVSGAARAPCGAPVAQVTSESWRRTTWICVRA